MTKSQSNQAFNTASGQQATTAGNAQSSYNSAQGDVTNYQDALAQYAAQNPYTQGGQFQTAQNQQMADTAAAGSTAAQQAITGAMVRSGLNPTAAVAAGEQVAEKNAQTEMGQEAGANEARLSGLSNYNNSVLNASAKPEEMEQSLMNSQLQGTDSALGNETSASKTPSFWQELGQGVIGAGGSFAGGFGGAAGKAAFGCWIAARVFDGWTDPRTATVRLWLKYGVTTWWGRFLVALYWRYGLTVAESWMPRSEALTGLMARLFTHLLGHAEEWKKTAEGDRFWRLYEYWYDELVEITPQGWHKCLSDKVFEQIARRPGFDPARPEAEKPVQPRFLGVL